MPNELSNLDLDEVSVVDYGGNQFADIMIYKAGQFKTEYGRQFPMGDYAYVPDPTKPSTWKLRLTADPGGGPNARIVGAVIAALGPAGFRGRQVQIPSNDLPKVKSKVLAAWKKLHPDAKELPASLTKATAEDDRAVFKLYVYGTGGNAMSPDELEKRFTELEETVKSQTASIETLTKERDEALAKAKELSEEVEKMKKEFPPKKPKEGEEDEDEEEAMKKALPEELRKRFEDLEKADSENKAKIAKMEEEREVAVFTKRATDEFSDIPVESDALGKALYAISKHAPDHVEVIEKALSAGCEALSSVHVEKGSGHEGGSSTALDELNKIAKGISKEEGITFEKAFRKAKTENLDLWHKHRGERTTH